MSRDFHVPLMSIGTTIWAVIPLRPVRHVTSILIALVTLVASARTERAPGTPASTPARTERAPGTPASAQPETVRTFEEDRVGVPPVGFVFSGTAPMRPDRWLVRRERDNNVLAHVGSLPRGGGIALAVLDGPRAANLSVAARFKLAAGDRPGGFVWRYQDPQNYYMVSLDLADVAEQEIKLYRVVSGNRIRIGREEDMDLSQKDWHVLKVVHANETIRVYLDGIKVFDVRDRTFRDAGAVGLWSADDAVMYFDDLSLGEGR
jgi:hypothetical protein